MKKYFIKNEFSDHFFYMLCGFCLLLLSLPHQGMAQKKKSPPPEDVIHIVSYEILENGDTINRLDNKNRKEGKWLIVNKGGYGEEDFIELGTYDHNIKMGTWKSYTMNGVIISQEYYKQGNKSGEAKYYDDGMLYCVGNYLALRSLYDYDTIMVDVCIGVEDIANTSVSAYPNPGNGIIAISISNQLKNETIACEIYNAAGMLVKSFSLIGNNNSIDISDFANGMYFLRILVNCSPISARRTSKLSFLEVVIHCE